jgi:hypothetical protein
MGWRWRALRDPDVRDETLDHGLVMVKGSFGQLWQTTTSSLLRTAFAARAYLDATP